jgi:hypothetical protein
VLFEMATWPLTVVLDSVTDACELVSEEIRTQSPPKVGKDGLPVDSERYWNVLKDRACKLIRAFRDLPMNVLYLCLLDDRTTGEDDNKVRWVGPQMPMRALPGAIQAAVNVVGVTFRKRVKDGTEYGIRTTGPDFMQLKPFPPLRDSEVTDFSSWCARINGVDDGSKPTAPPEEVVENKAGDIEQPKVAADVKPEPEKKQSKKSDSKPAKAEAVAEGAQ